MNVVFRVDSSLQIGSGHLMRCLTLAEALRERGAAARFICRDLPGNFCGLVEDRGFRAHRLPFPGSCHDCQDRIKDSGGARTVGVDARLDACTDARVDTQADAEETAAVLAAERERGAGRGADSPIVDLLIVDHYGLDDGWESRMRPWAARIMVIDDLADRRHDCDVLLDQNYHDYMDERYEGLVPERCLRLLGPKYLLLRPEFYRARRQLKQREGTVRRLLIFFGGSDPSDETGKALQAVRLLNRADIATDVVVGAGNPRREAVRRLCSSLPGARFHCQVDNMAELVAGADLAIGAGGTAMWERCYLGLPSLAVIVADNQAGPVQVAAASGAVLNVGRKEGLSPKDMANFLNGLIARPDFLRKISLNALRLTDSRADRSGGLLADLLMGDEHVQA